jgi:prepilin-type N-terminal cleavage/methylation domain-containing protein
MLATRDRLIAGFTIVELLVALAITSLLLAAVAVAFDASIISYQENEKIFETVSKARQALLRMTSQLRTGLVDPNEVSNPNRCRLICADGSTITYQYVSEDNKLYLHDDDSGNDYLLCDNVTSFSFVKDANTPTGDVKCVQISMTVASDNLEKTFSSAVAIRRTLP